MKKNRNETQANLTNKRITFRKRQNDTENQAKKVNSKDQSTNKAGVHLPEQERLPQELRGQFLPIRCQEPGSLVVLDYIFGFPPLLYLM